MAEPERLRAGNEFGRRVLGRFAAAHAVEGEVSVVSFGRSGRIDVFAHVGPTWTEVDEGTALAPTVLVVEAKHTDWDRLSEVAVRRALRAAVRQIWRYVEADRFEGHYVCAAVAMPRPPTEPGRRHRVECAFNGMSVMVDWDDGTPALDMPFEEADAYVGELFRVAIRRWDDDFLRPQGGRRNGKPAAG